MKGFIVKHPGFGLGKLIEFEDGLSKVFFFLPNEVIHTISGGVGARQALKRVLLPLNTKCETAEKKACTIKRITKAVGPGEANYYQVEFEDGLSDELSEVELIPRDVPSLNSPLEALAELQLEGFGTYLVRTSLSDAWSSINRNALGLKSLLSSRIDLRPHQAYVAGTVLMDRVPRYLLADEVGLGKTIEAGIIIHDLLERKPSANILIICPGTLKQQWLCELYAKFSSRVFCMLDLRARDLQRGTIPKKLISSYPVALENSEQLLAVSWDLIVVDEAHHLLEVEKLYSLTQRLSATAPSCLLLSAIPAKHRDEEYLRLLALLEPNRYNPNDPDEKKRFRELYSRQVEIGRKLSYLNRHLGELSEGNSDSDKIIKKIQELAQMPILSEDDNIRLSISRLDAKTSCFAQEARLLLHYIGDRYRISRRILRNRRSQLLDYETDLNIKRRLNRIPYIPEQLEIDVANSVRMFLHKLRVGGVSQTVLLPLARILFQASCDPRCLLTFIELGRFENEKATDLIQFDDQVSYDSWTQYASQLWTGIANQLPHEEYDQLHQSATQWLTGVEQTGRLVTIIDFLKKTHKHYPKKKLIIFTGIYGLNSRVVEALVSEFGNNSIAQFRWDQKDSEKEKQVNRFTRDSQCWILVSDESGGEGRNFQFADEIIHYDLPWNISRIEQRIGRLDRMGRSIPEVCSNVIYSKDGEDDGLLSCLEKGFQIFHRSISGLEFALSHLEKKLITVAISEGCEGLNVLDEDILREAENERASDDVQGVLDAASLERTSAEVYRRVQSTPQRDQLLESTFTNYFQYIGGQGVVRVNPRGYPEGVLEFRPDQLRDITLHLQRESTGGLRDRIGTFRRKLAQEDPNLEYFSVGNEFFDAVCATLNHSAIGRTYAVECILTKVVEWRGFEFAYRPTGRRDLLESYPGLIKHLDRLFAVKMGHCFVSETLTQDTKQTSLLLSIRKGLTREGKDTIWRNFTLRNGRAQLLTERYQNWLSLVGQAERLARETAREHFKQSLATAIDHEHKRIAEQIRQASISKSDGWEEEVAGLNALIEGVKEWDLELDFAGFLSVNGGLIS